MVWLVGRSTGLLVGWLVLMVGLHVVGWLVGCTSDCVVRLSGGYVGSWVDILLVGWLTGWLVVSCSIG